MSRHRARQPSLWERIDLNPEINRGLLAILLVVTAIVCALSFFNLAGVAGQFIDALLIFIFGKVRYVFPLILITVAYLMTRRADYDYRPTHWLGSILFFLSFNGIVQLSDPSYDRIITGDGGGGLIGFILAYPLSIYIGYWGGLAILIGLLITAIIFLFNTTLAELIDLHRKLFLALGFVGKHILLFFGIFKRASPTTQAADTSFERSFVRGKLGKQSEAEDEEEIEETDDEEESNDDKPTIKKSSEFVRPKITTPTPPIMPINKPAPVYRDLPPFDLLNTSKSKPTSGDIEENGKIIADTFKNFGIDVEMADVRVGPTVTQYSLHPAKGVKLTRITALNNDLALALAAHPIRIEAPIPGKSLVGIEVPNEKVAMVSLRELLESPEFQGRKHNMQVALGKDVAGKVWLGDLPRMPHLLIAGATGAGKTVGINTIILSLLYQNTPATLRFIMVDPKRVELTLYNGIPHLLTPVITDALKTVNALKWTIQEMERRFDVLAAAGKRDILSYNEKAAEPLPYLVFVIDELADLMATSSSEVEGGIIRIAQMARAVGIHLIVATQRPSVEVITGLMKANIPGRVAFSVASLIDSRTILDCPGAEQLLGRGDMLFLTAELSKPKRIQGAYVSEEEMKRVIDYLKGDEPPVYDETIVSKGGASGSGTANLFGGPSDDQDPLFNEAKQLILESGKASASLLQRRMKVGYARAARLLDELEEAGIVGPADGAKPREVFTEHLEDAPEMPAEEQTMDLGGSVFDAPAPPTEAQPENSAIETTEPTTTESAEPAKKKDEDSDDDFFVSL